MIKQYNKWILILIMILIVPIVNANFEIYEDKHGTDITYPTTSYAKKVNGNYTHTQYFYTYNNKSIEINGINIGWCFKDKLHDGTLDYLKITVINETHNSTEWIDKTDKRLYFNLPTQPNNKTHCYAWDNLTFPAKSSKTAWITYKTDIVIGKWDYVKWRCDDLGLCNPYGVNTTYLVIIDPSFDESKINLTQAQIGVNTFDNFSSFMESEDIIYRNYTFTTNTNLSSIVDILEFRNSSSSIWETHQTLGDTDLPAYENDWELYFPFNNNPYDMMGNITNSPICTPSIRTTAGAWVAMGAVGTSADAEISNWFKYDEVNNDWYWFPYSYDNTNKQVMFYDIDYSACNLPFGSITGNENFFYGSTFSFNTTAGAHASSFEFDFQSKCKFELIARETTLNFRSYTYFNEVDTLTANYSSLDKDKKYFMWANIYRTGGITYFNVGLNNETLLSFSNASASFCDTSVGERYTIGGQYLGTPLNGKIYNALIRADTPTQIELNIMSDTFTKRFNLSTLQGKEIRINRTIWDKVATLSSRFSQLVNITESNNSAPKTSNFNWTWGNNRANDTIYITYNSTISATSNITDYGKGYSGVTDNISTPAISFNHTFIALTESTEFKINITTCREETPINCSIVTPFNFTTLNTQNTIPCGDISNFNIISNTTTSILSNFSSVPACANFSNYIMYRNDVVVDTSQTNIALALYDWLGLSNFTFYNFTIESNASGLLSSGYQGNKINITSLTSFENTYKAPTISATNNSFSNFSINITITITDFTNFTYELLTTGCNATLTTSGSFAYCDNLVPNSTYVMNITGRNGNDTFTNITLWAVNLLTDNNPTTNSTPIIGLVCDTLGLCSWENTSQDLGYRIYVNGDLNNSQTALTHTIIDQAKSLNLTFGVIAYDIMGNTSMVNTTFVINASINSIRADVVLNYNYFITDFRDLALGQLASVTGTRYYTLGAKNFSIRNTTAFGNGYVNAIQSSADATSTSAFGFNKTTQGNSTFIFQMQLKDNASKASFYSNIDGTNGYGVHTGNKDDPFSNLEFFKDVSVVRRINLSFEYATIMIEHTGTNANLSYSSDGGETWTLLSNNASLSPASSANTGLSIVGKNTSNFTRYSYYSRTGIDGIIDLNTNSIQSLYMPHSNQSNVTHILKKINRTIVGSSFINGYKSDINDYVKAWNIPDFPSAGEYYFTILVGDGATVKYYDTRPFNITFTLINNTINISVYDESDSELIIQNVSIVFTSNTTEYSYSTINGYFNIEDLNNGLYDIRFSTENYSIRTYLLTLDESAPQSLNAYLIKSASEVVFTAKDATSSSIIEDASISMYRFISNVWTLTEIHSTDITGKAQFSYSSNTKYRFIVSHNDYETKTFDLNPILFSSYDIRLTRSSSSASEYDNSAIYIEYGGTIFKENEDHNFTFTIQAPYGNLSSYGYNLTYPGNSVYSFTGTNAIGESVGTTINITSALFGSTVNLSYWYKLSNGELRSFSRFFSIIDLHGNHTLIDNKDNTYELGILERIIIATSIVFLVAGLATMIAGGISGMAFSLIIMSYLVFIGFIPIWTVLISLLMGFMLLTWRSGGV